MSNKRKMEIVENFNVKAEMKKLEKLIVENEQLRNKYENDGSKFLNSEMNLHSKLDYFRENVIINPTVNYGILLNSDDFLIALLTLFQHKNVDIKMDVIHIWTDIIDLNENGDSGENELIKLLVVKLIQMDFIVVLINSCFNVLKCNDKDEAQGVYHVFRIVETFLDIEGFIVGKQILQKTNLLESLLKMIVSNNFDTNTLYAAELISLLLHSDLTSNCKLYMNIGQTDQSVKSNVNGLDCLLKAMAVYRKKDPASVEEQEYVENIENILNACLLVFEHQEAFRRYEGFELIVKCFQSGKFIKDGCLKTIESAILNNPRNIDHFIQCKGLKIVFTAFMGKFKFSSFVHKKEKPRKLAQQVEIALSMITTMTLLCPIDSKGESYERLHYKFFENDFQKCDRAVELFHDHHQKLQALDKTLAAQTSTLQSKHMLTNEEDIQDWNTEQHLYKLDNGLSTMYHIAYLLMHLITYSSALKTYILDKLSEIDLSPNLIPPIVQAYSTDMETKEQSERLQKLIAIYKLKI